MGGRLLTGHCRRYNEVLNPLWLVDMGHCQSLGIWILSVSLCVSLNAKLSSVQVFMAVINPPPQADKGGGASVRLHKHRRHNKARLI